VTASLPDFTGLPDLASRALGGTVVACNDEFFAPADNLVEVSAPVFTPRTFEAKGQVYDGWETRRRREPGHDWAIVRLGAPGIVRGVVVDTAHFTGNYPPHISVEGCTVDGYPSPADLVAARWREMVARSAISGDRVHPFPVSSPHRLTHVRLSIYPDGGVARFRVYGEVVPDLRLLAGGPTDLTALENGGVVVACSDMFYGSPNNLLLPGLARNMGEGWETARRRDGGNDWVTVRLGVPGVVVQVELDTSHFKGNAPAAARLTAVDAAGLPPDDLALWTELLPRTRLQPDTRHRFRVAEDATVRRRVTHVRMDIYPDGGMARLRLYGTPA
jgi:allantoicase